MHEPIRPLRDLLGRLRNHERWLAAQLRSRSNRELRERMDGFLQGRTQRLRHIGIAAHDHDHALEAREWVLLRTDEERLHVDDLAIDYQRRPAATSHVEAA